MYKRLRYASRASRSTVRSTFSSSRTASRLAAALQVDDGEPAGHHPERAVRVEPAFIGAPVEHRVRHPVQQRLVDGRAVEVILPRDPAHMPRASVLASRGPWRRTGTSSTD